MSWNYQLQDSAKVRFRARTKLMQIIRLYDYTTRIYLRGKLGPTIVQRVRGPFTVDDRRQMQNTKTKSKTIQLCKEWVDDKRRQETKTKTKHLCKEWVHDETKRTKQCYCQALYFNNPPKLMPDQTKRTLLKAAAHTGQCTPTHLH